MAGRLARGGVAGFTLLEVLIALVVLGLTITGLAQGVRTGLTMWNGQAKRTSEIAELDASARVLRSLLSGMQLPPSFTAVAAGETLPENIGYRDHLNFVGDMPSGLGESRRADMTVALRGGNLVLLWSPHRHELSSSPPPRRTETELVHAVEGLEFSYWGSPSPEQPAAWQQEWAGPGLPALIRLRLVFARADRRRWPVLIVGPQLSAQ